MTEIMTARKKELLAQKQKLLDSIRYFDEKIEEVRQNENQVFYQDEHSSDSDTDLCTPDNKGPSMYELKAQESQLSICLKATRELTQLEVLQHEMNVLVEPPQLQNGKGPSEPGLWREVMAECRVDQVPFSLSFHFFKPSRKFAAISFHNLSVKAVKPAHELELSKSVLANATTSSDVVQIIYSYAVAHRSRRTTLLAVYDKYEHVTVERMSEGGYSLKMNTLLDMTWTLENHWSPISDFMHRFKVTLENVDESYVKIVKKMHKKILDQSLETDERTDLLTNMLDVLAEAGGAMSNVESDNDSINKTRTTLDEEPEMPEVKKNTNKKQHAGPKNKTATHNKNSEIMGPPKQLPKKAKGKENVPNDQIVKKTSDAVDKKKSGVKRPLESNEIRKSAVINKANEKDDGAVVSKKSKQSELNTGDDIKKENINAIKGKKQKDNKIANKPDIAINSEQTEENSDRTDTAQTFDKVGPKIKLTKVPTNPQKKTKTNGDVTKKATKLSINPQKNIGNKAGTKRSTQITKDQQNNNENIKTGTKQGTKVSTSLQKNIENNAGTERITKVTTDQQNNNENITAGTKQGTKLSTGLQKNIENMKAGTKQGTKVSTGTHKNIENNDGTERITKVTTDQQNNNENIKTGTKQGTKLSTGLQKNTENNKGITKQRNIAEANVDQETKIVKPVKTIQQEIAKDKPKKLSNAQKFKAAYLNELKETPVDQFISGNVIVTDGVADTRKKIQNKQKTTIIDKNSKQKSNENLQNKPKSTENTTKFTKNINQVEAGKNMKPQQTLADTKIPKIVTKLPLKAGQNLQASSKINKNVIHKPKSAQDIVSKIPKKKMATTTEENQRKSENPLRISPRKQGSSAKVTQQGVVMKKTQKHTEPALKRSPILVKKPRLTIKPRSPVFKPKSMS